jgi:excinuclease UvrABC ATPase subunit
MKGVINLDSIKLPPKRFNAKKAGGLVGTITDLSEYIRLLYAMIGKSRDNSRSWTSQDFSESSPYGACSACNGTGTVIDIDPSRMIAPELSLKRGAVLLWAGTNCRPVSMIKQLAKMIGIDFESPLAEQDKRFTDILLYGYDKEPVSYVHKNKQLKGFYRGCVFDLRYMRDAGTTSKGNLRAIDFFSGQVKCPKCNRSKLNPESLTMTIHSHSIVKVSRLQISELLLFIQNLPASLDVHELKISSQLIDEIELRLIYLNNIGLKSLSPVDDKIQFPPRTTGPLG